eukprot:843766-Heterocapsa_arctica.AAC.1
MEIAYCANAQHRFTTYLVGMHGMQLCVKLWVVAAQSDQSTNGCRATVSLDHRGHHNRVDCAGGNILHEATGPLSTCIENNKKVYIDGSATKIGASAYAGWGMWSPDTPNFKDNGALIGRDQGSDRAEVRALVAALGNPLEESKLSLTINMSERQQIICLQVG